MGEPSINFWNVNKKGFEDEIGGLNTAILYIKATCLSVCPGNFHALPVPFFFFFFFFFIDGFCFLWQLLLDGCIMHQVHTSDVNYNNRSQMDKSGLGSSCATFWKINFYVIILFILLMVSL